MDVLGNELLPARSKAKYEKVYRNFTVWQQTNEASDFSEKILVAYFQNLSLTHKPTSLYAYYSMLKATIKINHNIDISDYRELNEFLRFKSCEYKPTQSLVFTKHQIDKFIFNAPDDKWIDVKVACIFAVVGELYVDDLVNLTIENIEKHGDLFLVRIYDNRLKGPRSFTITGKYCDFIQKYSDLRSPKTIEKRFFVRFLPALRRCTIQMIGKQKFAKMPERVATYLKIPEPHRFTGHSFRRSGMERRNRYGSWDSSIESPLNYEGGSDDSISSQITPGTQSNSILDPLIKSEPFDDQCDQSMLRDPDESIIVKTEPADENMCDDRENCDLFSRQRVNLNADSCSGIRTGTGRMYKCEQCGHMNKITPSLQDGFFDGSQSIGNSSRFQVSVDPLSLELRNNPLSSQSNEILDGKS